MNAIFDPKGYALGFGAENFVIILPAVSYLINKITFFFFFLFTVP